MRSVANVEHELDRVSAAPDSYPKTLRQFSRATRAPVPPRTTHCVLAKSGLVGRDAAWANIRADEPENFAGFW
jgi:hypothetical protein